MKKLVYAFIILLAIAHQDFWWWDNSDTLVLGFVPIGLAYHAGVSVLASIAWALAIRYCWPLEADADQPAASGQGGSPA